MKLDRIRENMLVASYKDMCALLEENPTNHQAKRNQFQRWRSYFQFEQKGQKFLITKVFDGPVAERLLPQMTSKDLTQILFLQWLLDEIAENSRKYQKGENTEPGIVRIEQRRLLYLLGILNKDGLERLGERKETKVEKEFFGALTSKSYFRLMEVFEHLMKQKILLLERGYLIRRGATTTFSSREETQKIFELYDATLRDFSLLNMSDVFLTGCGAQFYKTLAVKLESEMGIDWHEECYLFAGFPDRIALYMKRIKGFDLCQKALLKCSNDRSQERMRKFGLAKWADYQQKKDIIFSKEHKNVMLPEDFLQQIEMFVVRFIALAPIESSGREVE